MAVGKDDACDGQRNAEVDHPPRVGLDIGVRAAVFRQNSGTTAVDSVAGWVTSSSAILVDADLSGRHVGRHVTNLICVH